VQDAALAAQRTTDYAETLLRLAHTTPETCRAMCEALGIPPDEWPQVLTGVIPPDAWDRIAKRALDEVTRAHGPQVPPASPPAPPASGAQVPPASGAQVPPASG
jgi:hypothetical protein